MTGGQGLHVWYQAQFPDRCLGFLLAETRQHEQVLLEGAVMHENGEFDVVTGVRHSLAFDDSLDLVVGTVEATRVRRDVPRQGGRVGGRRLYGGRRLRRPARPPARP
jgi:hypothetical protein